MGSYQALSYEWGPMTEAKHIQVDGEPFMVSDNLYQFLSGERFRQLKQGDSPKMWIDQISIDQSNIKERNHQVQRMSEVYSNASLVIMWLGQAGDGSDRLMEQRLSRNSILLASSDRPQDRITFSSRRNRYPTLAYGQQARSLAIDSLFKRSYFERLWVVQEILLARHVQVRCGQMFSSWTHARHLCMSINTYGDKSGKDPHLASLTWALPERHYGHGSKMSDLLQAFGVRNKCTDPRDRVYGLQALVPSTNRVQVDYARSVTDVFFDTIVAIRGTRLIKSFHAHIPYLDRDTKLFFDLAASMEVDLNVYTREELHRLLTEAIMRRYNDGLDWFTDPYWGGVTLESFLTEWSALVIDPDRLEMRPWRRD